MAQTQEQLLVELAELVRNRYFGKYRGLVQDVEDPVNMGRITPQVPELFGEETLPWAMPCVPFAGSGHGLMLLPEPGDGVWIEFEAGDPSRPIWSGCWWAGDEMPPEGTTQSRALVTTAGHKLVLDDEAGEIRLIHSGGAGLTITGSTITLETGSTKIELSSSGISMNNGALEVL